MRKAIIVATEKAAHHHAWGGAFAEGLRRRGWDASVQTSERPCDLLVVWGTRRQDRITRQKAAGGEVCVLERGYLGDRFAWTSVSFGGGLNGRGEFRAASDDPERFQRHFGRLMKPWHQPEGGYALLIGQVPGDMSIRHVDIDAFYGQSAVALKKHGWPVVHFRPHPKAGRTRQPAGAALIGGTLQDALRGAGVVMTFNSNTGVEAALFGRPVIAMDEGSMAWPVAGHQVTEIVTPDRAGWAARLAWCQFETHEFASGYCQEVVGL